MLQSLRLWNRAFDNLCRLVPPSSPGKQAQEDADNPFITAVGDAGQDIQQNTTLRQPLELSCTPLQQEEASRMHSKGRMPG